MNNYIGLSLNECIEDLNKKNIKYIIKNNNHNVDGDSILVTNAQFANDNTVILTVGSFIFDLKD